MSTREDILSLAELTRPVVGIEYRTAGEVYDIMCDRIRRAARLSGNSGELAAASTPPAANAPEGWWMAPRAPTAEMVSEAVYNLNRKYTHNPVDATIVAEVWGSMKHARPKPPAAEAPGQEPVVFTTQGWLDSIRRNLGNGSIWGKATGSPTEVPLYAAPPTYADAEAKEVVARIIDPMAFADFEGLRDYCLGKGDTMERAMQVATGMHRPRVDRALEKADAVLAAIRSLASPAPKGET